VRIVDAPGFPTDRQGAPLAWPACAREAALPCPRSLCLCL